MIDNIDHDDLILQYSSSIVVSVTTVAVELVVLVVVSVVVVWPAVYYHVSVYNIMCLS